MYMGFTDNIAGFNPNIPFGGIDSLYWISQNGFNNGGSWYVIQGGSASGTDEFVAGDTIAIKLGPDLYPDELYLYRNGANVLATQSSPIIPTGRFIVGFCDLSDVIPAPI
jgi:hypothetical protein